MLDPLPPPPSWLVNWITPYSKALYLPSLPYHIHEVVGAFVVYQSTQSIISPILSNLLFPHIYPKLTRRTRINWDVHVVSLLQSVLINTAALWVMFTDKERKDMDSSAVERIYGYTGASGLIQGLATGYFVWDLVVSTRYLKIFGPGILAHAVTALAVFSLGFVSTFRVQAARVQRLTNMHSARSAITTARFSFFTNCRRHSSTSTGSVTSST